MKSNNLIGILLSGICIIHCLAFPLLTLVLSLDTFASFYYDETKVHIFLFILVSIIYLIVFPKSFINDRRLTPIILASIGVISLFTGLFQEDKIEIILTVFGGILLMFAHYKNYKILKSS
ncbi:MAG: MerC domain-containing protein [Pseudomonadota bacterium]|nr:MerC domain-containing protein [Pseudomonadota bacterium]